MAKETISITPIVFRIGASVALSFGGFLFARFIDRKPPFSIPPISEHSREEEITRLKHVIKTLEERESKLELELFELYGLREQFAIFKETQNRLKLIASESKLAYLKLDSLQGENQKLATELQNARYQIRTLKAKLANEAKENRGQIVALKEKVSRLVENKSSGEEEKLRRENEEYEKKVKELEAEKCVDAEELVQLRWVNACLRYELHKAREQSKNPLETPSGLIDYAEEREIEWSSSDVSLSTKSGELERTQSIQRG